MLSGDPWLQRWLPLLQSRAGRGPLLELGCGAGEDTAVLVHAGLRVTALDVSPRQVALARQAAPVAEVIEQDLRASFPLPDGSAAVVVASLSVHYFAWDETLALVQRLHRVLQPQGLLLCRLNSTRDHHFGASGHPRIEDDFYLVDGQPKRFFDEPALDALFGQDWHWLGCAELRIGRYAQPKVVWECVLEKAAGAGLAP